MKLYIIFFLTFSLWCIEISCKSQTEKISETSAKVVEAILENDTLGFMSFIAHDDWKVIGKDSELVIWDVKEYNRLLKQYYADTKHPIVFMNDFNFLGQYRVKIPIYENKDSSVHELHLDLLFGPPNFFPMNKITDYLLVENNSDSSDFHPYSYWKEQGIAK